MRLRDRSRIHSIGIAIAVALSAVNASPAFSQISITGEEILGTATTTIDYDETMESTSGDYTNSLASSGSVNRSDPSATPEFNLTVTITQEVQCTTQVLWSVDDGNYNEPANWVPQQVPGDAQVAVFDRDAVYTVSVDTATTAGAIVERGGVTLDGITYILGGGNAVNPSFIVGRSTANTASAIIRVQEFMTLYTVIAGEPGSDATVRVVEGAAWTDNGAVAVGFQGAGALEIRDDALLTTSELFVGDRPDSSGTVDVVAGGLVDLKQTPPFTQLVAGTMDIGLEGAGTLDIRQNGAIETGAAQIGASSGATGAVNMAGDEVGAFWTLSGDLIVANDGTGTLTMGQSSFGTRLGTRDGESHNLIIANGPDSVGVVRANGQETSLDIDGEVQVGPQGDGMLIVENFAVATAQLVTVGPFEGLEPTAIGGDLIVQGRGVEPPVDFNDVTIVEDFVVGEIGPATLNLTNEAAVQARNIFIASGDGGDVDVLIDNSSLDALQSVFIGNVDDANNVLGSASVTFAGGEIGAEEFIAEHGSTLRGAGGVLAGTVLVSATVSPGVIVEEDPAKYTPVVLGEPYELKRSKQTGPIGALTFDGNATFDGAELRIDIQGTNEGEFDRIAVTGDASLTNVTITLTVHDGYTPAPGDRIPFLDVAGELTMSGVSFVVQGADPIADFNLEPGPDGLMLVAQSEPEGSGDGAGEGGGDGSGEGSGETGGCAATAPTSNTHTNGDAVLMLLLALALSMYRVTHTRKTCATSQYR